MTRLLLIRHAETDWNAEGRYQGQTDVPLNERGRKQATRLAEALREAGLGAVYSSDLARARETAEALARAAGVSVRLDPRLREINQGEWEGMLFAEIEARYPEELARREAALLTFAAPGGEAVEQVRQRVLEAVEQIARRHPNGTVAVVSHGLALALVRRHFGHDPDHQLWELIPENCAVVEIEVRQSPRTNPSLLLAVVQSHDAPAARVALEGRGFQPLTIQSQGGFLGEKNQTLLVSLESDRFPEAIKALEQTCRRRLTYAAFSVDSTSLKMPYLMEVEVGGAIVFGLDVERLEVW